MGIVKIFGDSHSRFFLREQTLARMYGFKSFFDSSTVYVFHGASVKGFGKKISTLNIKDKILEAVSKDDTVVLCFGQVDIESGILYKRFVKQETISDDIFITECLLAYKELINIVNNKVKRLIIKGINFPVVIEFGKARIVYQAVILNNIRNPIEREKAQNLWKSKFPKIVDRINLVIKFNAKLKFFCDEHKIEYFDVNDKIAYENGFLKEEYMPIIRDHHLADTILTRKVYIDTLLEVLKRDEPIHQSRGKKYWSLPRILDYLQGKVHNSINKINL